MKKKVKQYGRQVEDGTLERHQVLKDFSRMLDSQVYYMSYAVPDFNCYMLLKKFTLFAFRLKRLYSFSSSNKDYSLRGCPNSERSIKVQNSDQTSQRFVS